MLFGFENKINHKKIKKSSLQVCHTQCEGEDTVFMQRASLSVPLSGVKGSMTVEAALVVPLFLFAVFGIMEFFCIMSFQNDMQISMENTAREISTLKYGIDMGREENKSVIKSDITAAYVYARVLDGNMMNRINNGSSVVGAAAGVSFLRSDFTMENNYMDMVADYGWKIPFYNRIFTFTQRCCFVPWTGKSIDTEKQNSTGKRVYITKTGKVYHLKKDCTYLRLSIKKVRYSEVGKLRNAGGGKYKQCEVCCRNGATGSETVYITTFGDRYHKRKECSTLLRYIHTVDISQVGNRRACTKCSME